MRLVPLLVLLAAVAAASAAAASGPARLLSCAGRPLVRPSGLVVLSCADGNTELRGTRWLSWTRTAAVGVADFGVNLCTPTCAASKMSFFPHSRVRLAGAVKTRNGVLFSRAAITYVFHGVTKTFVAYPPTRPL